MNVIADCGHVIQEDQPVKVCETIWLFIHSRKTPEQYNQQNFIITATGKKIFINH